MKNNQPKKSDSAVPLLSHITSYKVDNMEVVLLSDLLVCIKQDTEWFNSNFPNPQENISAKYCLQIDDNQQWVFDCIDKDVAFSTLALTETGSLLVASRLEQNQIAKAFEIIKKIFSQSPKSKISYANLTPLQNYIRENDQNENTKFYHEVLDNALSEPSNRNIAIAAPYGGGKTTIINSYFDRRIKNADKVIFISLATFDALESEDNKPNKDYERQKIEKNILQQLLYQTEAGQLPESRILRIHNISTSVKNFRSFQITIFLLALVGISIDKIFPAIYEFGYTNVAILSKLLGLTALVLLIPPVLFDVFKSVKNIKINKFSTLGGDIELSSNRELSVFNQFIDELLYFFEVTKIKYVVIEDLDRFGDVEIFNRLRSLNQTLNKYPPLKETPIIFIYAMRDDVFAKDHRDRTKFFDLIIPIIPFINFSNSKDKFKSLLTKDVISKYKISELFIDDISYHIQDMRLLKNIVNEFLIHCRLLKFQEDYDGNELLAAIIYKNLEPEDFAAFHENKGYLKNLGILKICLAGYVSDKTNTALKPNKEKLKNMPLKKIIDEHGSLFKRTEINQSPLLNEFFKAVEILDEKRQKPLYDTYFKSDIFLALVQSGYLNENVDQYISYLHMDTLTIASRRYVKSIRERDIPENLELDVSSIIVEKIGISAFDHKVTLIPKLINYIFDNEGYDAHCDRTLNLLILQKQGAFQFLMEMTEYNSFKRIVAELCGRWEEFWIHAPTEFVDMPKFQSFIERLPEIEDLSETIKNSDEKKLKILIDGEKLKFNRETLDIIALNKPNSLAYILFSNQGKIKDIQIDDEWLGIIRTGHPQVSKENLKNIEITMWPVTKGFHDIKEMVRANRIKYHSVETYNFTTNEFRTINSDILEADKGFIAIWAWVDQFHLKAKSKYENRYILSHALDGGKKSQNMPENKHFYPSGWAIHLTNPKVLRPSQITKFNCKFFCNKKNEPEDKEGQVNKGIMLEESIAVGWHLFTVAWNKKKNYIKFFVDDKEITNKNEDFTYENYWPDEYSGKINIGCWEDKNDETHHYNSKIGPYIMVTEELTRDMLESYFASKPS